jgi:hypothetical protein
MDAKTKSFLIGSLAGISLLLLFGIPTDLIPNRLFIRMIPATALDYVFLVATSVLLGGYVGLLYYRKSGGAREDLAAMGGGVAGIFAFGCPICNAILVSLVGSSALLTYYEPVRPLVGVLGIALLAGAVYLKMRCGECRAG